jgi:hypothetical protein
MGLREARLRPEAAADCPWATPDVWHPAATLAAQALRHSGGGVMAAGRQHRALPEHAFEFRGGLPELALRSRARTRWSDHPSRWRGTAAPKGSK